MNVTFIRCVITVLLIASFSSARKIKRKGNYIAVHPQPPPQPHAHPHAQPPAPVSEQQYSFEKDHLDGFANVPPHQQQHYDHERYSHHSHYEPSERYGQHTGISGSYLTDNGLRSIAKGSADQANSAVASQNAAGKQAAYVAKSSLAHAATQAAGTAVAVLKGKEVLLHRLEEQNAEAHKVMQGELQQLQQAKRSAKAAQYAAQQALNHVSVLTAALNNAQSASELAQKSASEAAAELASQIDMVAQAKTKLEQIESQLYTARLDYEETKDTAEKATLSAQEAQLNAKDAALHANAELQSESHAISGVTSHVHLQDTIDDIHDDHEVHSIAKRRFNSEKAKKP